MRKDILDRKEDILKWISENRSKAFICRELKCKPETLDSYLDKMDIVYFGNKGMKGFSTNQGYKNAYEYSQGTFVKSYVLKLKLFRDGIKEKKCEICGLTKWNNVDIPLELHHKDGNHFNNDFDNLQILCPNCHALQNNNSGAGVGNYSY